MYPKIIYTYAQRAAIQAAKYKARPMIEVLMDHYKKIKNVKVNKNGVPYISRGKGEYSTEVFDGYREQAIRQIDSGLKEVYYHYLRIKVCLTRVSN